MRLIALLLLLSHLQLSGAATIAIIDTGFDLDHDFLKPRVLKQETDEEAINPNLKEFNQSLKTSLYFKKFCFIEIFGPKATGRA
jgi:hypothetical protein